MQNLQFLEIAVSILLVAFALLAVFTDKAIKSIIYLSILSMVAVVAFSLFRAPDVAITEAVIGSGLVTFIFMITIKSMQKEGDIQ